MGKRVKLVWKSKPLPIERMEDEEWLWQLYERAFQLAASDEPSVKDVRSGCLRYNQSTAAERDAMDSVFVWFTGYTLSSIAGMVNSKSDVPLS